MPTYVFQVGMTCSACANAIGRILNKMKGDTVADISVDWETGHVQVTSDHLAKDDIEEALQNWGQASGNKVEFVHTI